jgi:hypothetical protein
MKVPPRPEDGSDLRVWARRQPAADGEGEAWRYTRASLEDALSDSTHDTPVYEVVEPGMPARLYFELQVPADVVQHGEEAVHACAREYAEVLLEHVRMLLKKQYPGIDASIDADDAWLESFSLRRGSPDIIRIRNVPGAPVPVVFANNAHAMREFVSALLVQLEKDTRARELLFRDDGRCIVSTDIYRPYQQIPFLPSSNAASPDPQRLRLVSAPDTPVEKVLSAVSYAVTPLDTLREFVQCHLGAVRGEPKWGDASYSDQRAFRCLTFVLENRFPCSHIGGGTHTDASVCEFDLDRAQFRVRCCNQECRRRVRTGMTSDDDDSLWRPLAAREMSACVQLRLSDAVTRSKRVQALADRVVQLLSVASAQLPRVELFWAYEDNQASLPSRASVCVRSCACCGGPVAVGFPPARRSSCCRTVCTLAELWSTRSHC